MVKGLTRSLSRGQPQIQHVMKQTFVLKDLALEIDGASGVGFGTVEMGELPEGNIVFLGAVGYMQISGPGGDAGLADTWAGDYAVGTTPMSDATISDGDEDILVETALAAATAEVSPLTRATHLAADVGEIHDNTDGSLELNLNVLVDDADISADDIAFTADGKVTLIFSVLLDD